MAVQHLHGRSGKINVRKDRENRERLLSQLLFADDTALNALSAESIQSLLREFGRVCESERGKNTR